MRWSRINYAVRTGFWLRKRFLLKNISFTLKQGSVTGLVGPNGAGKTTTLKIGAGILKPDNGQIFYRDKEPLRTDHLAGIGFLPELQYYYPNATTREWLLFMGSITGKSKPKIKDNMAHLSEQLQLTPLLNRQLHTLSKGQAQRVGIAQTLMHEPAMLLLDEPMSGLDPFWRYKVHQLFREYHRNGGTILFSSHILADVEELCDYIVLIQNGTVQWQGATTELHHRISKFQVICANDRIGQLQTWAINSEFETLPSGDIAFFIQPEHKTPFLRFTLDQKVELRSIRPHFQEIGKILFDIQK